MKFKATKKEMRNGYHRIIGTGYCNMAYLLKFRNEIAYSTRSEGWACDYYEVEGVLISTGYAPLESKNTHSTYDIIKKYDDQAQKIAYDYSMKWEDQKEAIEKLLHDYIKEVAE